MTSCNCITFPDPDPAHVSRVQLDRNDEFRATGEICADAGCAGASFVNEEQIETYIDNDPQLGGTDPNIVDATHYEVLKIKVSPGDHKLTIVAPVRKGGTTSGHEGVVMRFTAFR